MRRVGVPAGDRAAGSRLPAVTVFLWTPRRRTRDFPRRREPGERRGVAGRGPEAPTVDPKAGEQKVDEVLVQSSRGAEAAGALDYVARCR